MKNYEGLLRISRDQKDNGTFLKRTQEHRPTMRP
jgi:hypothetical protein